MRKNVLIKAIISLFILISSITMSKPNDSWHFAKQEKLISFETMVENNKHMDLMALDYIFADYFLENTKINKEIADEFLLVLPDVRIIEKKKDLISKLGKQVIIFLLKNKNNKLEYRSEEELKLVQFAKNVKIVSVTLDTDEITSFIKNTENDAVYFQDYFKYNFYKQYKKATKYDYLKVIRQ